MDVSINNDRLLHGHGIVHPNVYFPMWKEKGGQSSTLKRVLVDNLMVPFAYQHKAPKNREYIYLLSYVCMKEEKFGKLLG